MARCSMAGEESPPTCFRGGGTLSLEHHMSLAQDCECLWCMRGEWVGRVVVCLGVAVRAGGVRETCVSEWYTGRYAACLGRCDGVLPLTWVFKNNKRVGSMQHAF